MRERGREPQHEPNETTASRGSDVSACAYTLRCLAYGTPASVDLSIERAALLGPRATLRWTRANGAQQADAEVGVAFESGSGSTGAGERGMRTKMKGARATEATPRAKMRPIAKEREVTSDTRVEIEMRCP